MDDITILDISSNILNLGMELPIEIDNFVNHHAEIEDLSDQDPNAVVTYEYNGYVMYETMGTLEVLSSGEPLFIDANNGYGGVPFDFSADIVGITSNPYVVDYGGIFVTI